jgi:hypothetical protein
MTNAFVKIKFRYQPSQSLEIVKPRAQQLMTGQLLTVLKYNIFISNLVSFASFINSMIKKIQNPASYWQAIV